MKGRATFIAGMILAAAGLTAPTPAGAQTDPAVTLSSIRADLHADAFDGGGTPPPPKDVTDPDFVSFTDQVTVADSFSDNEDRKARAQAFQDTDVLNGPFRGVDSNGFAIAETGDIGDEQVPNANSFSEFRFTVEVSGGPAAYRAVGEITSIASPTNQECSLAEAVGAGGELIEVAESRCPDSVRRVAVDETGLLPPGEHFFRVSANAHAQGNNGAETEVESTFDIRITFEPCSIVAEPGVATVGTGERDVICGTDQGDDIRGADGGDEIYGFGGVDSIEGEGGPDQIFGGAAGDIAVGGGEADFFIGADGVDSFTGGPGQDFASGGPERDLLFMGTGIGSIAFGDAGDDIIEGGQGADDFDGGPGTDRLMGFGGQDVLRGKADDDCLVGGPAKDDFRGGLGDDTLLARDSRRDIGSGGPGPDRGRFDAADTIASVANRGFQGGC